MGTVTERKRKDGSKSYTAQIRIMRDGKMVHSEAQTFERKQAAKAWLSRRENELSKPGALEKKADKTLGEAIEKYVDTSRRKIGKTKEQCLNLLLKHPVAGKSCSTITSVDISSLADDLVNGWHPSGETFQRKPQTVGNYLSHLGAVFAVAKLMWGYDLDQQAYRDAVTVSNRMGVMSRSKSRDRRPTVEELDRLLDYFEDRFKRVPRSAPMHKIVLFALFSSRRQEEIVSIRWEDYDKAHKRVLVRDMKHPGEKMGNDVWCDLPDEAIAIIDSMDRIDERIFPYSTDAVSARFTRACHLLGIADLRFHDARHDCISRLFELGWNIPHVATVSGHRSWNSLKRYSHIRQSGDKYEGWRWKP